MVARQIELVVRRPGQPERRYALSPGTLVLGRAEDNDVVLSDIGISRRHARIHINGEGIVVEDIGSGNGTWYRGKRVSRQVVGDGDEVTIEPFLLAFSRMGPESTGEVTLPEPDPNAANSDGARLIVTSAHRMPRDFVLNPSRITTIGRSDKSDVVLPEPASSRDHAEIGASQGRWWIRDKGSSNGTFVNATRIRDRILTPGDRIRIGAVEFQFTLADPAGKNGGFDDDPATVVRGAAPAPASPSAPTKRVKRAPKPAPGLLDDPYIRVLLVVVPLVLLFGGLLLVGGVGALVYFRGGLSLAPTSPAAPSVVVAGLLARGDAASSTGAYMDAANHYFEAAKADPTYGEARRRGYGAVELAVWSAAGEDLSRRAAAPVATASPAPVPRARTAEPEPEIAPPIPVIAAPAATRSPLADRMDEAAAAYDAGRTADAVKIWEEVARSDGGALGAEARERVERAKSRMSADSAKSYRAANAAMESGDNVRARNLLKETLALNPYHAEAKAQLREVDTALQNEAAELYKEARRLEDIEQHAAAKIMYKKVMSLAGTGSELHDKASARLAGLP